MAIDEHDPLHKNLTSGGNTTPTNSWKVRNPERVCGPGKGNPLGTTYKNPWNPLPPAPFHLPFLRPLYLPFLPPPPPLLPPAPSRLPLHLPCLPPPSTSPASYPRGIRHLTPDLEAKVICLPDLLTPGLLVAREAKRGENSWVGGREGGRGGRPRETGLDTVGGDEERWGWRRGGDGGETPHLHFLLTFHLHPSPPPCLKSPLLATFPTNLCLSTIDQNPSILHLTPTLTQPLQQSLTSPPSSPHLSSPLPSSPLLSSPHLSTFLTSPPSSPLLTSPPSCTPP
ncbi:hypothetical protein Pmani_036972 [Petrolisthes manimaculis]|uniref:Uncharacterized protein n=1 Tax=Petrolisthes manimaculis TaxID=1843537 RepID=A0AAE1NHA3_9EUCA|nr:hypothetical protein Pmani_036972 [Petrolisthes manimaculis]